MQLTEHQNTTRQKRVKLKGETDKSAIVVKDFNTLLQERTDPANRKAVRTWMT